MSISLLTKRLHPKTIRRQIINLQNVLDKLSSQPESDFFFFSVRWKNLQLLKSFKTKTYCLFLLLKLWKSCNLMWYFGCWFLQCWMIFFRQILCAVIKWKISGINSKKWKKNSTKCFLVDFFFRNKFYTFFFFFTICQVTQYILSLNQNYSLTNAKSDYQVWKQDNLEKDTYELPSHYRELETRRYVGSQSFFKSWKKACFVF